MCKELELGKPVSECPECSECQKYKEGSGDDFHIDTLRRFTGFFIIQANMTFNMPHLFTKEELK